MSSFIDDPLVDDDFSCISIVPSSSGENRVVKTKDLGLNTDELFECGVGTNTDYETVTTETQCEAMVGDENEQEAYVNMEYLGNWLEAIYPKIANILEMNGSSRTFEHYEIKNDDTMEANILQHTLITTFEFTDPGAGEDDEEGGDETGSFQEYQDDIDEWGDMASVGKKTKPSVADTSSVHSRTQNTVAGEESKTLSFDVTSIDWSCNGSTIAVAYGKQNHPSMSFQG